MKIYIASSWKHAAGVIMLTSLIRQGGHSVASWIENCGKEQDPDFDLEQWVKTPEAAEKFAFDINSAMDCDLLVYYGRAGKDASAELGAAFAKKRIILGIKAKDEDFGLMRMMVSEWFDNPYDLVRRIGQIENAQLLSTDPGRGAVSVAGAPHTPGLLKVMENLSVQDRCGFNSEYDGRNNSDGQLVVAARYVITGSETNMDRPAGWNPYYLTKLARKPRAERLAVAASLLIAEINRISK